MAHRAVPHCNPKLARGEVALSLCFGLRSISTACGIAASGPPLPRPYAGYRLPGNADDRKLPRTGNLIIGTKGKMLVEGDYWDSPRLIPEPKTREFGRPERLLERSPGHHQEFIMELNEQGQITNDPAVNELACASLRKGWGPPEAFRNVTIMAAIAIVLPASRKPPIKTKLVAAVLLSLNDRTRAATGNSTWDTLPACQARRERAPQRVREGARADGLRLYATSWTTPGSRGRIAAILVLLFRDLLFSCADF